MQLLTYLLAAALLWAVAATGPATPDVSSDRAPRAGAAVQSPPPRASAPAYPR